MFNIPGLASPPLRDGYASPDGYFRIGRLQVVFGGVSTSAVATTTETFSAAFKDANFKVIVTALNSASRMATFTNRTTTGCDFDAWNDSGARVAITVFYVAIGIWA